MKCVSLCGCLKIIPGIFEKNVPRDSPKIHCLCLQLVYLTRGNYLLKQVLSSEDVSQNYVGAGRTRMHFYGLCKNFYGFIFLAKLYQRLCLHVRMCVCVCGCEYMHVIYQSPCLETLSPESAVASFLWRLLHVAWEQG